MAQLLKSFLASGSISPNVVTEVGTFDAADDTFNRCHRLLYQSSPDLLRSNNHVWSPNHNVLPAFRLYISPTTNDHRRVLLDSPLRNRSPPGRLSPETYHPMYARRNVPTPLRLSNLTPGAIIVSTQYRRYTGGWVKSWLPKRGRPDYAACMGRREEAINLWTCCDP